MKNSVVKPCAVLLVLMLIVSTLSVPAFAAASMTFFTKNSGGYSCTGSGTVSDHLGTTIFNATPIPLQPIMPPDTCELIIWVYAYDDYGRLLRATLNNEGTTSAIAQCTTTERIRRIECTYTFNYDDLGIYDLYNS